MAKGPNLPIAMKRPASFRLDAMELVHDYEAFHDLETFGFLMRLVAASHMSKMPMPQTDDELRRIGIVMGIHSIRLLKRLWPRVSGFFTVDEDGYMLPADNRWYQRPVMELTPLLQRLVERWGTACVYCCRVRVKLQIEHIIPTSRGGSDHISNLTLACAKCNSKKSNQTAAEFGHPHIEDMARSFVDA